MAPSASSSARPWVTPCPWATACCPTLFAADRKDHLERVIEPKLMGDVDVVSDRYYHSSLAYQSLAMPLDQVMALNAAFRAPDLCIFLDLDVASCMARIDARGLARDRFETKRQLEEISAQYGVVLGMLKQRGDQILVLDAAESIPNIHKRILAAVEGLK